MMRQCTSLFSHRSTVVAATAASFAWAAVSQCSDVVVEDTDRRDPKIPFWRQQCILNIINYNYRKGITSTTAKCDAMTNATKIRSKQELPLHGMDHYYIKMNPDDMFEASSLDSHALFGPLLRLNLIERFNVYKRINTATGIDSKSKNEHSKREIAVVDLKLGNKLNGHKHGIISLLLDTALGFGYQVCLDDDKEKIAVTASLKVDFRAPLKEESEAVVRVYLDGMDGRKIFFSAVLESKDGSVVYAEAKSLFIKVDRIKVVKKNP